MVTLTVYLDFSMKTSGSRFKEAAELFSARKPWYLAKVTSLATQRGAQSSERRGFAEDPRVPGPPGAAGGLPAGRGAERPGGAPGRRRHRDAGGERLGDGPSGQGGAVRGAAGDQQHILFISIYYYIAYYIIEELEMWLQEKRLGSSKASWSRLRYNPSQLNAIRDSLKAISFHKLKF